jgi:hypothetical protein
MNRSTAMKLVAVIWGIVAVLAVLAVLLNGNTKGDAVPPGHSQVPVAVSQPASAEQVASSLGCGNFQDKFHKGGDPAVLDAGICWIGNTKYAIDTFASAYSRDAWLKLAEQVGVVPKWETDTSVAYKSVTS